MRSMGVVDRKGRKKKSKLSLTEVALFIEVELF